MKALSKIQKELKASKGQYNSFGKYRYRSCEDILESVKPLLGSCSLTLTDEIILIGERFYVKATATIVDTEATDSISVSAFAREPLNKKGMDESQITGTASSYARKYALNGLFCIDDAKDPDTDEYAKKTGEEKKAYTKPFKKAPEVKKEVKKFVKPEVTETKTDNNNNDEELF